MAEKVTVPEEKPTVPMVEGELQSVQTYDVWQPTCETRNGKFGDKRKVVYGNGYPLRLAGGTKGDKLYTHISYGAKGSTNPATWSTPLDLSELGVDSFTANGSTYYDLSQVTIYGGTGTVDPALYEKVPIDYGGNIYMLGGEVASLVGGSRINGCNNTKIVMVGGKVNGNIYGGSMGCLDDFREYTDKYFTPAAYRDHTLYTYIATVRKTMTLSINAEVGGRIYGGGYAYACTGSGNVYVSRTSVITGVNGEKVVNGPENLLGGSYQNGYEIAYYIDLFNGAHSVNNTGAVNYMVLKPGFSPALRTDPGDENHIVKHDCKNALYATDDGFELKGNIDPSAFPNAGTNPFELRANEKLRLPAGSVLNLTTAKLSNAGTILLYSGGSIIGTNGHIVDKNGKVIFPITAADIVDIPDMPYTGSAVTPAVTFKPTSFPLLGETYYADTNDYILTYTKNVNAGKATATLTNKYDSSLSISKKFTILGMPCKIADAQFVESETLLPQTDGSFHAYYTSEILYEQLRVKFTLNDKIVTELPAGSRIKMGDASKYYVMANIKSTTADKDGYFIFTFQNKFPHGANTIHLAFLASGNFAPCAYIMAPNILQYVIQCASTGKSIFLPTSTPMTLHAGNAADTTTLTCSDGHTSKELSLSSGEIYKYNAGQNDITMNGGTVGTIYAGNYYEDYLVPLGKVTINGGTLTTLAAARDDANRLDKTTRAELTVTGGNVGTIRSARACRETYITVTGGTVGTITGVSSKSQLSQSMHLLISGGAVDTLNGKLDSGLGKKSDLIVTTPLAISGCDTFDNRLYFNGNHYVLENKITLWDDLTLGSGNLVTAAASQLTVPVGKTLTVPADAKVSGSGTLAIQEGGHLALTAGIATLSQESYPTAATPATPTVTVKLLDKTFTENVDYTVTYANNTSAGIATATVTAKAGSPLTGTAVLQYDIGAAAGAVALNGYALSHAYTGKPIPNPTSEQVQALSTGAVTFTWYKGTLNMGQLATAISLCGSPREGGDYTLLVKVASDGKYAPATALAHITIVNTPDDAAASSSGDQIKPGSGWYTGDVTLTAPAGYQISTVNNGPWTSTLVITEDMDRDYVYYLKNIKTGAITTQKTIHVRRDTTLPDVTVAFSGNDGFHYTVTLSSTDLFGIAVCRYFDYTDGYLSGDTLGDPAGYVTEAYARKNSQLATGMVFEATTIPGARAKLYLFLEDAAGHTSVVKTEAASRTPLIKAEEIVTTIDPVAYTGGQIFFKKDEVTATYHGKVLPSSHYTIGAGSNDCLPGTYQAVLAPIKAFISDTWQKTYTGSCTPTYTILKAPLRPEHIQLTDAPVYTGIPYIPENIKVQLTDKAFEGSDYFDMVGVDNINAGTAHITVKMKDSAKYFSGEATIPVEIKKATASIDTQPNDPFNPSYNGQEIKSIPRAHLKLSGVAYDELQFAFGGTGGYPKEVGQYQVTISVPDTSNHTAASKIVSFRISGPHHRPAEIPVIILKPNQTHTINLAEVVQSYLPQGQTVDLSKLSIKANQGQPLPEGANLSNGTLTYSLDKAADTHVWITYEGSLDSVELVYRFVVTGLTPLPEGTIVATVPEEIPYTGTPYTVTATLAASAPAGGTLAYKYESGSSSGWNEVATITEIGYYRVVITYTTTDRIATLSRIFSIVPAASQITATPEKIEYTYGDGIRCTVTVPGDGSVELYRGDVMLTSIWKDAPNSNVQPYYGTAGQNVLALGGQLIQVKYGGNSKYKAASSTFTISLAQRPIAVTAVNRPYAIGCTTVPLAVATGFLAEDSGKVALNGTSTGTISSPNAGTYTVTAISATLTGEQAKYYQPVLPENLKVTITPQVLSNAAPNAVTIADIAPLTYTGSALTPAVVVKDGETLLTKGTDYTVAYSGNTDAGTDTATATVTFKGNYNGTMTKNFTIGKAASTLGTPVVKNGAVTTNIFTYGDTITVTFTPAVAAFALTAPAINQAALYLGESQLTGAVTADENGQFTLSYATVGKGIPVGSQTLIIKYGGSANLGAGSASATITLNPKPVTATVSGTITKVYDTTATTTVNLIVADADKVSTGDAITVTANAAYSDANAGIDKTINFSGVQKSGDHSSYYTVSAPSSATGEITAKPVASPTITLEKNSYTYTGSAIEPAVTSVKDEANTIPSSEYTVKYSANTDVSDTAPTVTITDKANGNYAVSGSVKFEITKSDSTTTPDTNPTDPRTYTYGDTITLTATVGIQKAAPLAALNQVEFFCGETALGTAQVIAGVATLAYDTADKKLSIGENKIKAVYGGSVNLNGSASGEITVTLNAKPLTDGMIAAIAEQTFTGSAITPTGLTVTDGSRLTEGADYTIQSYASNTNAGTGSVTIQGAGWYTGTAAKGFTINPKATGTATAAKTVRYNDAAEQTADIAAAVASLKAGVETLTYTLGSISDTHTLLAAGTAVDSSSGNLTFTLNSDLDENSKDKTATVELTVTGLTNYATVTVTVTITITDKISVTVDMSGITLTDKVYDGAPITYAGAATGTYGEGENYSGGFAYKWYKDIAELEAAPTDVGSYTLKVIVSDPAYAGEGTKTVQITKASQEAPAGLTAVRPTTDANADGKITGLDSYKSYEYKLSGGADYAPVDASSTEITGLAPGTYLVRVAGDGNHTPSGDTAVTVKAYVPTVTFDSVTANGASGATTTTQLTITLGGDTVLTADNITLTGAVKGVLTGSGSIYTLAISGSFSNGATVTVTLDGDTAVFAPASHDVTVYQYVPSGGSGSGSGGGAVNSKPTVSFNQGGTATATNSGNVTITPDKGYQIGKITVNGKEVTIPENGKLTGLTRKDNVEITFEKIPQVTTPVSERFTDIPADAWYAESVQFVVDNGLFSGTSKTAFSPKATTTRATLWAVLYRHAGATTKGEGTAWYSDAQAWAKEIGISDGKNPEGEISREQLATILYRYAKGTATTADMSKFSDTNEISGFAAEAMNWAVEQGILQGANGKLNPKGNASRAEVAAMVTRFVKNMAN
ncbi:MAG: S-layer homology domain-containing protein [Angelakisella sp.]